MEALALTVVCREGRPPVHAVFLPDGCCPQPVPCWSACPAPGPAEETRAAALADLAGAVITVGALHTQGGTAQAITGRQAGYVMTVRASMATPCKQLEKLPWTAIPATSAVSTGHGRRARRTIRAVLVPAWTGFAGAAQVAQVRRTVTRKGKKTVEVVYLMTSDRDAGPATLAAWVRGHRR